MNEPRQETSEGETAPQLGLSPGERYMLQLFVTGTTRNSVRAISNLKNICEQYLPGRYEIEIVDIYQDPIRAKTEQIIAAPTLIRTQPGPSRRLVGDMSDHRRVLAGLGLPCPPMSGKSGRYS